MAEKTESYGKEPDYRRGGYGAAAGTAAFASYEEELDYWRGQERMWRRLDGKTVMLSGATGMIGMCLTDLLMLRGGIRVIAISRNEALARQRLGRYWDRPEFRFVSCDVGGELLECGPVDCVIHAASNTHPRLYSQDPIGTISANVQGTANLLEYGASHGAGQFCFLSSVEIYGENRGDVERFQESYLGYLDCNTLRAGYPEGKRLGEALCNAYREARGLDFVIPRLSRVYGPTMLKSDSKAISQFIKKAAAGEDIVLKSRGDQEYSYTFVTDAAAAVLWCMAFGTPGEAYNVADERSDITLKELARSLAGIAGTRVVFELPDETEQKGYSTATRALLDGAKLRELGWEARVHMAEGLRCVVESWRE